MGTDAGVGGVYGIYLPDSKNEIVAGVYRTLKQREVALREDLQPQNEGDPKEDWVSLDSEEVECAIDKHFREIFIEAFKRLGIVVPPEAELFHTGSEDERPARCSTPPGEWCLGFGILTPPSNYPTLDPSFNTVSFFHTWVWMG